MSSFPGESIPSQDYFPGADKLLHALEYAVLSFLIFWALGMEGRKSALIAIAISSLYAISDEFHQSSVAGRYPSAGDWLADVAGAVLVQWTRLRPGPSRQTSKTVQ